MPSTFRSRSIIYTAYNYGSFSDYAEVFRRRFEEEDSIKFAVFQEERCPETNRLHVQGFVQFSVAWRLRRIQQLVGSGAHVEARKGKIEDAVKYCSKQETRESDPVFLGEIPVSGRRNDLEEIRKEIDSGATELEIAEQFFGKWCIYRRSFEAYRQLRVGDRTFKTRVVILWGLAGTGKTRAVYDGPGGPSAVYDVPRPNGGSVWFDGYAGQDITLLDDFYGWVPFHLLLKLGDRYPLQLPRKGGFVKFRSRILVITSNKPWQEWYDWSKLGTSLQQAFRRRIDACVEFGDVGPVGIHSGFSLENFINSIEDE
jgi:hypothetical protein